MSISRKIILIGFLVAIVLFIVLVIYPLFTAIQEESVDFASQRAELAKLEMKTESLRNFQKSFQTYQPDFDKIEELFIDASEPVDFIDFLEKEADKFDLSLEILPLAFQPDDEPWPSMNFKLSFEGNFSAFLNFIERLESAPYLIKIVKMDASSGDEGKPGTSIGLLIKVYAR